MKNLKNILGTDVAVLSKKGEISVSVLDNPREILRAPENASALNNLLADMQIMAAQSFGIELDNQTDDGVRSHIVNVGALAFIHDEKKVLGFASAKFENEEIFYLHGVAVAHEFKRNGGAYSLVKALLGLGTFSRIALTTQNPIMFCLLRSLCWNVYPSPDKGEVPEHLGKLGKRILQGRSGEFDSRKLVINNLYGKCLYKHLPRCGNEQVNNWFDYSLNVRDGITRDAFLLIGDGIK